MSILVVFIGGIAGGIVYNWLHKDIDEDVAFFVACVASFIIGGAIGVLEYSLK